MEQQNIYLNNIQQANADNELARVQARKALTTEQISVQLNELNCYKQKGVAFTFEDRIIQEAGKTSTESTLKLGEHRAVARASSKNEARALCFMALRRFFEDSDPLKPKKEALRDVIESRKMSYAVRLLEILSEDIAFADFEYSSFNSKAICVVVWRKGMKPMRIDLCPDNIQMTEDKLLSLTDTYLYGLKYLIVKDNSQDILRYNLTKHSKCQVVDIGREMGPGAQEFVPILIESTDQLATLAEGLFIKSSHDPEREIRLWAQLLWGIDIQHDWSQDPSKVNLLAGDFIKIIDIPSKGGYCFLYALAACWIPLSKLPSLTRDDLIKLLLSKAETMGDARIGDSIRLILECQADKCPLLLFSSIMRIPIIENDSEVDTNGKGSILFAKANHFELATIRQKEEDVMADLFRQLNWFEVSIYDHDKVSHLPLITYSLGSDKKQKRPSHKKSQVKIEYRPKATKYYATTQKDKGVIKEEEKESSPEPEPDSPEPFKQGLFTKTSLPLIHLKLDDHDPHRLKVVQKTNSGGVTYYHYQIPMDTQICGTFAMAIWIVVTCRTGAQHFLPLLGLFTQSILSQEEVDNYSDALRREMTVYLGQEHKMPWSTNSLLREICANDIPIITDPQDIGFKTGLVFAPSDNSLHVDVYASVDIFQRERQSRPPVNWCAADAFEFNYLTWKPWNLKKITAETFKNFINTRRRVRGYSDAFVMDEEIDEFCRAYRISYILYRFVEQGPSTDILAKGHYETISFFGANKAAPVHFIAALYNNNHWDRTFSKAAVNLRLLDQNKLKTAEITLVKSDVLPQRLAEIVKGLRVGNTYVDKTNPEGDPMLANGVPGASPRITQQQTTTPNNQPSTPQVQTPNQQGTPATPLKADPNPKNRFSDPKNLFAFLAGQPICDPPNAKTVEQLEEEMGVKKIEARPIEDGLEFEPPRDQANLRLIKETSKYFYFKDNQIFINTTIKLGKEGTKWVSELFPLQTRTVREGGTSFVHSTPAPFYKTAKDYLTTQIINNLIAADVRTFTDLNSDYNKISNILKRSSFLEKTELEQAVRIDAFRGKDKIDAKYVRQHTPADNVRLIQSSPDFTTSRTNAAILYTGLVRESEYAYIRQMLQFDPDSVAYVILLEVPNRPDVYDLYDDEGHVTVTDGLLGDFAPKKLQLSLKNQLPSEVVLRFPKPYMMPKWSDDGVVWEQIGLVRIGNEVSLNLYILTNGRDKSIPFQQDMPDNPIYKSWLERFTDWIYGAVDSDTIRQEDLTKSINDFLVLGNNDTELVNPDTREKAFKRLLAFINVTTDKKLVYSKSLADTILVEVTKLLRMKKYVAGKLADPVDWRQLLRLSGVVAMGGFALTVCKIAQAAGLANPNYFLVSIGIGAVAVCIEKQGWKIALGHSLNVIIMGLQYLFKQNTWLNNTLVDALAALIPLAGDVMAAVKGGKVTKLYTLSMILSLVKLAADLKQTRLRNFTAGNLKGYASRETAIALYRNGEHPYQPISDEKIADLKNYTKSGLIATMECQKPSGHSCSFKEIVKLQLKKPIRLDTLNAEDSGLIVYPENKRYGPAIPMPDGVNRLWAFFLRNTAPQVTPDILVELEFRKFIRAQEEDWRLLEYEAMTTPLMGKEEYLRRTERRKRTEYAKGFKEFDEKPVIPYTMSYIAKWDEKQHNKPLDPNDPMTKKSKGRGIYNPSPQVKGPCGLNSVNSIRALKRCRRYKDHFIHGEDSAQLQEKLTELIQRVNNPLFVYWDGVAHDSHQHAGLREAVDAYIFPRMTKWIGTRMNYSALQIKAMIKRQKQTTIKFKIMWTKEEGSIFGAKRWMIKGTTEGGVNSGEPWATSQGNFTRVCEYIKFMLFKAQIPDKPETVAYFISGDDVFMALDRQYKEAFEAIFWTYYHKEGENIQGPGNSYGLGQVAKSLTFSEDGIDFLSKYGIVVNKTVYLSRQFHRSLTTGAFSTKIPFSLSVPEFNSVITGQLKSWGMKVPGIRSFIEWRYKHLKHSATTTKRMREAEKYYDKFAIKGKPQQGFEDIQDIFWKNDPKAQVFSRWTFDESILKYTCGRKSARNCRLFSGGKTEKVCYARKASMIPTILCTFSHPTAAVQPTNQMSIKQKDVNRILKLKEKYGDQFDLKKVSKRFNRGQVNQLRTAGKTIADELDHPSYDQVINAYNAGRLKTQLGTLNAIKGRGKMKALEELIGEKTMKKLEPDFENFTQDKKILHLQLALIDDLPGVGNMLRTIAGAFGGPVLDTLWGVVQDNIPKGVEYIKKLFGKAKDAVSTEEFKVNPYAADMSGINKGAEANAKSTLDTFSGELLNEVNLNTLKGIIDCKTFPFDSPWIMGQADIWRKTNTMEIDVTTNASGSAAVHICPYGNTLGDVDPVRCNVIVKNDNTFDPSTGNQASTSYWTAMGGPSVSAPNVSTITTAGFIATFIPTLNFSNNSGKVEAVYCTEQPNSTFTVAGASGVLNAGNAGNTCTIERSGYTNRKTFKVKALADVTDPLTISGFQPDAANADLKEWNWPVNLDTTSTVTKYNKGPVASFLFSGASGNTKIGTIVYSQCYNATPTNTGTLVVETHGVEFMGRTRDILSCLVAKMPRFAVMGQKARSKLMQQVDSWSNMSYLGILKELLAYHGGLDSAESNLSARFKYSSIPQGNGGDVSILEFE